MTIERFEMTPMTAYGLVSGVIESDDEEQLLEAWQHLVDTGMIYSMPGEYGRMAQQLIDAGEIAA